MRINSIYSLWIAFIFIAAVHFFYYPKWEKTGTEATLSWDVSGYYMYLPAIFIYHDIKNCDFREKVLKEYQPTPDFQQAFIHEESGSCVMKYSIGQALQFSPFFFIGHLWSNFSKEYPSDGFSFPYQFMISMGSLVIAFIGLFFLRKSLLNYFSETATGLGLLLLVFGTNYLNYTAIDGAMTHNNLFTLYALLIFSSITFYRNPTHVKAMAIGFLVGLCALTRPTEILSVCIPLFWGINIFHKGSITHRLQFLNKNWGKILSAIAICILLGSLQLVYWKYVTGNWIVYSYEDQGFSWLNPHIWAGMFSYKSGWLMYSPIMIFSLIGFYSLYKKNKEVFTACIIFTLLFIYVAFAWDIWWYGGSLGQRTMVQAYPILFFPLIGFFEGIRKENLYIKTGIGGIVLLFVYLNLWFTHQAHKGGLLPISQVTKEYYWEVLGTFEMDREDLKLLDTDERFNDERKEVRVVNDNDFTDLNSELAKQSQTDSSDIVLVLNDEVQYSPLFNFTIDEEFEWLRAIAEIRIEDKEWNHWIMTQFIVRFKNEDEVVKERMIRIQRLMNASQRKSVFIDVKKPVVPFTEVEIHFWNANGKKAVYIGNLKVEVFNEAN